MECELTVTSCDAALAGLSLRPPVHKTLGQSYRHTGGGSLGGTYTTEEFLSLFHKGTLLFITLYTYTIKLYTEFTFQPFCVR